MNSIQERLRRLTRQQRAMLAAKLPLPEAGISNTRLVAFIVPVPGHPVQDLDSIRRLLAGLLPEYMIPSFILTMDALPLTPNGKVDRKALEKIEPAIVRSESKFTNPTNDTEKLLTRIWSEVLSLESLSIHDNFFELGGDSILSIHIVARARQAGLEITPALLFKHPTVVELARIAGLNKPQVIAAQQDLVIGDAPLTPIQQWFFDNQYKRPNHWNQALLLRASPPSTIADMTESVKALFQQHDALRTRFTKQGNSWEQEQIGMPSELPVEFHDLTGNSTQEQSAYIDHIANHNHQILNLEQANLFRLAHFRLSNSEDAILLILHHLITDGVSWRLLLEDLHTALEQTRKGEPIKLPPKSTSYQIWSQHLKSFVQSPLTAAAAEYWLSKRFHKPQFLPRDYDVEGSLNTEESSRMVALHLSENETRSLLEDVPSVYNTQINDILLTALSQTLAEWIKESSILVAMEGHGRETFSDELDITRTVGWFTTVFPVRLNLITGDLGQVMLSIKEQVRAIPDHGISHGILKSSEEYSKDFANLPEPEFLFNYLGRSDTLVGGLGRFELKSDEIGTARFPGNSRRYLIEVNSYIRNGQFHSRWNYSHHIHKEETVKRLAGRFHQALIGIIDHCKSPHAGGYSRSDFPLADLSEESFDQIADLLDSLDD